MNIVGILGTIHNEQMREKYNYSLKYIEDLIVEFNPDIICGEIRPEDFKKYIIDKNYDGYLGPNEYRKSILPLCEKHNIKFEPIDWFEDELIGLNHFDCFCKSEQIKLENKLDEFYERIFENVNVGNIPFNNLKINEIVEKKQLWLEEINKDIQNLVWTVRNQIMNLRIKKVIEKNKDSKILCTFGMEHNYFIYKELKKMNDVILLYPIR